MRDSPRATQGNIRLSVTPAPHCATLHAGYVCCLGNLAAWTSPGTRGIRCASPTLLLLSQPAYVDRQLWEKIVPNRDVGARRINRAANELRGATDLRSNRIRGHLTAF